MQTFNNRLIAEIEEHIPKKKDRAAFLADVIAMGKETIYRRLRGDTHFTFSEACIIANKLGISLDKLAEIDKNEKPVFELELSPNNPIDYIYYKLAQHEESYDYFIDTPNLVEASVFNTLPYSMLFPYEELFKFHMFKLIYQLYNKKMPQDFSSLILPKDINERRKNLAKKNFYTPQHTLILNRNLFQSFLDEIKYFYTLELISDDKKEILKDELLEMVLNFRSMSERGLKGDDVETWIYLSNVDLNSNYTYVKGEGFERAYMDGIYLMDTISSSDPLICRFHREWIESLKRFSTLISISGEIERKNFFEKQIKLIYEF